MSEENNTIEIKVGDVLEMIKAPMKRFEKLVGEKFIVESVDEDRIEIQLPVLGYGSMSFDECKQYFRKLSDEESAEYKASLEDDNEDSWDGCCWDDCCWDDCCGEDDCEDCEDECKAYEDNDCEGDHTPSAVEDILRIMIGDAKWTPWLSCLGFKVKTDLRKTVRVNWKDITEEAQCHPSDKFDLITGITICLARIAVKKGIITENAILRK